MQEARQHVGGVYCIATDPMDSNGGRCFSGSNDFTVNMWRNGKFAKLYAGHSGGVRCILALGPTLWTGSDDVREWPREGGGGGPAGGCFVFVCQD